MGKIKILSLILATSFFTLKTNAFVSTQEQNLYKTKILDRVKNENLNFSRSQIEKDILQDLKDKRLRLDDLQPEPFLEALNRELSVDRQIMDQVKLIAKYLVYDQVRRNWKGKLEYTILNEELAKTFKEFSYYLIPKINSDIRYLGIRRFKAKPYFVFSVADWAHIRVSEDLSNSKVHIEFNSGAENNRLAPEVENL